MCAARGDCSIDFPFDDRMTPNEFDFTVRMPGDERLVGAIKQLTAHAAGYARLTPAAGEALATQVERATESAIAAATARVPAIEYRFTADPEQLVVTFSCDATHAAKHPSSDVTNGVTIEWTTDGSRHVCRIRQPLEPDA
jgi:hypothetical protein